MQQQDVIQKFQEFVATEGETLGRLLVWAEQRVMQKILQRLHELGYADTSLSELGLMQQICLVGMRQNDLAHQMKMSKQAVGQLLDSLERKQLVTRSPDPNDRRAKVIAYTPTGYQFIADTIDATLAVEQEIAELLGKEAYMGLKNSLLLLNEELD
ncbi:transcriptional regulator, MarR family [Thalassoporum mexicanum PCC 7367]|uniref:MarR family winged helix-turn-helix transcriptional regulator n=1 Tax=Thalassoporum mexicanum TaxID=3457544 RepID=UPI00029FD509|nr:MarR family transcriptional regulator [Pseudanabaena sp. PCC 7367]AFY69844.1 transcriptional regulator, MarR family [Pseudanabaena sp. PCC 7367]